MELPSLIGPAEWREFCDSFRQRRAMVKVSAIAPRRFAGLWAEWAVDAITRFTPAPDDHARFRVITRGKTVAPALYTDRQGGFQDEAFRQLLRGGASLALANFESFFNPALALSRHLEAEFCRPVQVNLYVTPAGGQGLGSHVDPHDVLILQLCGEKTWNIYGSSDAGGVATESVLTTGSWLFLPKGNRHEVRNQGAATSVHLTVGFHPLTWGEAFQRALDRARVSTPAMNAPLLPGAADFATREDMLARLSELLSFIDLPDHLTKYYGNFSALAVPVPVGHLGALAGLDETDADTLFGWRNEATLARGAGGGPEVTMAYRRAPLALRADLAEPLELMRTLGRFMPRQLTAVAPNALLLCRFLAGAGVLEWAERR